jgi:hypothetical protein
VKILLRRYAGHGDILCLTNALPGLRRRYPDAEFHFQTGQGYGDLILGHPEIHQVWETANNVPAEQLTNFDLVLEPDHGTQWNDTICRVQCRMLGVTFTPPQLFLHPVEVENAPVSDVCVVNYTADARTYPQMAQTVRHLLEWGWNTLQIDNGPNLGCAQSKLTMRQAAAAIARTQVLLTVDTAAMHVGVALQKPMVIVFGDLTGVFNQYVPNAWLARTKEPPDLIAGLVTRRLKGMPCVPQRIYTDRRGDECVA